MSMNRRGRARASHLTTRRARVRRIALGADDVLDALLKAGVPLDPAELASKLHVPAARRATLADLLARFEHEGRIIRNRRGAICLTDRAHLIKGRVQGHPDGFGFLVRDDGEADCFISPRQMHKVMHGDRVVAREAGTDRRGRSEVIIVEVLERANTTVVGRLRNENGILSVEPEDKRISQPLLVSGDESVAGGVPLDGQHRGGALDRRAAAAGLPGAAYGAGRAGRSVRLAGRGGRSDVERPVRQVRAGTSAMGGGAGR